MTETRLPPQNLVAERSLLGSQMLDARKVDDVREIVSPSEFYFDTHTTIQQAIFKLRDGGSALDPVTLATQLEADGTLQDIGGVPYLMEIMEAVPHAEHAAYYARIVSSCARRRRAASIAQKLAEAAYDPTRDEQELSNAAIEAATKLADQNISTSRVWTISEAIEDLISEFETGSPPTASVMVPEIDELIGGLAAGEMMIIGGRPSHGKSMLAIQSLDCASLRGWPVMMISEEMLKLAVAGRMLQRITDVESDRWMVSTIKLRHQAAQYLQGRATFVVAEQCGTIAAVERVVNKAVRDHGIKVLAVDYAQLLDGEGHNEQERITDVSRRIKALTTKHGLRTLLLAQMNRAIETREGHEPELSDLRGSGSLEQDGDVILFPTWPYQFDKKYEDPLEYRIYQRKNRNRGISKPLLKMRINPQRQWIEADDFEQRDIRWEDS